ncbi:MAG: hypothetical protein HY257_10290 [Chloroflexi bacterium]|nr:hypothetical protein [Chloroflexota bacterium]
MKPSRLSTAYWLLLTALFLAHSLFYFFALGTDAVDDAYISFRYAQNAIHGYGLVFNPNERVEGFTNFLWTALFIPLEGARVDVGRASMLIGALFALGTLALVIHFARYVHAPRGVGILAALLLAADGSFVLWGVAGLETPLFAFLIFAGALLYVKENQLDADERGLTQTKNDVTRHPSPVPLSGIFFALAAMTRPEGALVFAITVAHQVALHVLFERRVFTRRDFARVFAFAAIFVPYWLARWFYYKSFLPNSFYAKVSAAGPAAQIERGWNHLQQFVNVHLGWVVIVPLLAALALSLRAIFAKQSPNINSGIASSRRKLPLLAMTQIIWTSYFAIIILVYSAYIVYVGGDWSVGRFFAPLLPFFYLLFSTGLNKIFAWVVERWSKRVAYRANKLGIIASGVLAALILIASSWNGEYGIYIRGFDAANATRARETIGKWLNANVPRGTLIAVDAAGQVPYFAELPAVDMFGINDLYIGRLQVPTLGQGTPGHEKFDLGYVIARQPQYVVIYGTLFDAVPEYERASVAWTRDEKLTRFLTLYRRK